MPRARHLACVLALTLATACTAARSLLPGPPPSPRDEYAASLTDAGLDTSTLGVAWLRAGTRALETPVDASLPFRETGYFGADDPSAVAYRLNLSQGRVLAVDVQFTSTEPGQLFVDLFRERRGHADGPERVASLAPESTDLRVEIEDDGAYLLRLQPELLRSGRYTVVQRTEAALRVFPVSGEDAGSVQSGFGAPRDGGGRSHEGIDIFAPRNTPVVAVVDGTAHPSTNTLGGTVVWLRGDDRRFYYAHLERTAFTSSRRVQAGDVIGYVGNSGNARTTSPHLHFGIYARRPVDPLPFVGPDQPLPATGTVPADLLGRWARTTRRSASLRDGAAGNADSGATLERHDVFRVRGATATDYRVQQPDGTSGYVSGAAIEAVDSPVASRQLDSAARLIDAPHPAGVLIAELPAGMTIALLGRHESYSLVRTEDHTEGWIADDDRADAAGVQPRRTG